jgi:DNA-binding NarL/FixJ family response regulator
MRSGEPNTGPVPEGTFPIAGERIRVLHVDNDPDLLDLAARAIAAGVSGYLQKQGSLDQFTVLANRIETLVDRYRAQRHVRRSFKALEAARDGTVFRSTHSISQQPHWRRVASSRSDSAWCANAVLHSSLVPSNS